MGVQPPAPPGSGAAGRSPAGGAIRVTTNLQTNHYKIMAEIAIGRYDTNTLKLHNYKIMEVYMLLLEML